MTERRYSEDEVAAIFERAAKTQHAVHRPLSADDGLTLKELQAIGSEVGIAGDLIVRAAHSLEVKGAGATRSFLGLPIGVGRTIEFDRRLTDDEWDHLVVDLRQTFDARGSLRSDGSFRQWTNGNLQALLEPTPAGHRLRLRTLKGNARGLMAAGLAAVAFSGSMAIVLAISGSLGAADSLSNVVSIGLVGLGLFGLGAIQVPGWARLRRRQMDEVTGRLEQSISANPTEQLPRAPD